MSRPLRIEYPGAWHHVMNRGRRRETIFFTDADREEFIKVLRESAELWNLSIAAYCLMSNHYHLLVKTPDGNLARGMRHLNGVYTQRFNRSHKKEGQLFRGRYKAVLVDADSHLLEVLRYIHRNPLKAGIVKNLNDYRWSSHKAYVSQAKKWTWVQKENLLSMLTAVKSRQKRAYLDFVAMAEPEEIERFYALKDSPSILGNASFIGMIRDKLSELTNVAEIPESKILALDAERVIAATYEYYRIPRKILLLSKRGSENLPRDVAIYLVRRLCRMTLPDVGKVFGIENYSSVSSVVQRVKLKLASDKHLQKKISEITQQALKGKGSKSQKRT